MRRIILRFHLGQNVRCDSRRVEQGARWSRRICKVVGFAINEACTESVNARSSDITDRLFLLYSA